MITQIFTILIVGIVLFELIEHILFPLLWGVAARKKKSPCGIEGMPGKLVEVWSWQDGEGRVFVDGELWNAASDDRLQPGDGAIVQEVQGLVLKIVSSKSDAGSHL